MPFVVMEGLDGSGKTTLLREIEQILINAGKTVDCTREPGGTPFAEEIRGLLLKRGSEEPVSRCELLLYSAARAQHVFGRIQPALNAGKWVLSDRFFASTYAFQAGGRELDVADVKNITEFATGGLKPDLTILMDITLEECVRRQERRTSETGQEKDRLEAEDLSFHAKVREAYLEMAKTQPNWLVLDASLSVDQLKAKVIDVLKERKWL